MNIHPRWRRKKFLVNHRLQLRFMGMLVLQMSVILSALGLIVYAHMSRTADLAASVPFVDTTARLALEHELIDNAHGFYARSLALMGVTTVLLLVFGLFASHKLAGPVVKLDRYLRAIAAGDFSQRIAFRRNDHLDEFARSINRMVDALETRDATMKEAANELLHASAMLETSSDPRRVHDELRGLVGRVREAI